MRDTNEDNALTAGCPTWEFLAVGNGLVEEVDRTSPDMEVVEPALGLSGTREQVKCA